MKLYLTIKNGSLAGRVYDLQSGFLTVGRGENCTVRFDPQTELSASKQHAYIELKPDGFYLTDNRSTNGTFLNGRQITSEKLHSGDAVRFGKNGVEASIKIENTVQFAENPQSFRGYEQRQYEIAAEPRPLTVQKSISQIGLGGTETVAPQNQTNRYIGIGVTIFAIIFLSLIVSLLIFASVGIGAAIMAAVVAFIPAMFYLLPLVWLDRYDPEPLWLLALAFAWGALVAVVVSFVVNTIIGAVLGGAAGAVISAPIFEEGSKGIGLLILLFFFRREFDDILDGIVYAGVIALGFATVENVLYYGRGIAQGGSQGLLLLFFMRGILSPFAHVTFTSMTGIGCGISRESHNPAVKYLLPFAGYICAVILHAIWNGMAVIGGFGGFVLGYVVLEIPFFLLFVGFAGYVMHRQNKILKEMLAIDIARGLIPQQLADKTTSALQSSLWILGGLMSGKFLARSRFVRAAGKLGLSYWHIQRATAAQGQTGSFQQNPILREEVLKWRDKV